MTAKGNFDEVQADIDALLDRVDGFNGLDGLVGISGSDAIQAREGGITNAELGAIHEFGAPAAGVPERSFMRSTFDENRKKYEERLAKGVQRVVDGTSNARRELLEVAEVARADVIAKIDSHIPPPLKPATIRSKGGETTPLVKTGRLRSTIKAKVE